MRKITFPHMGELSILVKTFLRELGLEVVAPPKISRKTLNLGVKYSPEFACLPFKINLGNFIEAIEKGADTILMGSGCGPCRFGYYGELQREILNELGYEFEMITIEPDLIADYHNLKRVFHGIPAKKYIQSGKLTWRKMLDIDRVYELVLEKRASEKRDGLVNNLYQEYLRKIENLSTVEGVEKLSQEYLGKIKDTGNRFKRGFEIQIGIVGEIYMILESFANLETEKKLGELGAVVKKDIYISSWLYHFLHLSNKDRLVKRAARGYLDSFVGGHGLDTVGNTVRYARDKLDGVIQIGPFTCMPEIISQTILPAVSKKEKIPVISLFFDEHSADAGLKTRLEAFVDLLARRKAGISDEIVKHRKGANYG